MKVTNTNTASHYNDQGLMIQAEVEVRDMGDTILIGNTEHLKDDLDISEDEITPKTDANKVPAWRIQLG